MFTPTSAWAVLLPGGTLALHTIAKDADIARGLLLDGDSTPEDWLVLEKAGHRVVPILIQPVQQSSEAA